MNPKAAYEHIIESITDYLRMYGLWEAISFVYHDSIKDVDVLWPTISIDTYDDLKEVETILTLMEKHHFSIPPEVSRRKLFLQKKIDQRESIKYFEDWIISYFTYLDLEDLHIEAVYYSNTYGIMVKFYERKEVFKQKAGTDEPPIFKDLKRNKQVRK